jgi:hypothetical protein
MPPEEVAQRKAIAKKALRMPPEAAGEIMVKGIERRSPRVQQIGEACSPTCCATSEIVSCGIAAY